MMMCLSKWISATLAVALVAGTAAAADTVGLGKIKSINADNKTFVLTDYDNKDHTFKIGDNLIVNRDNKETKSDLKVGDAVNVSYTKGTFSWTANYILVQEGKTKNCELVRGTVKAYNPDKKELAFTDEAAKTTMYPSSDATVRLCHDGKIEAGKADDLKIGDHALIIIENRKDLKSVMVDRTK